ncbi:MAG: hypothetical protein ACJA0G_002587 [Kangiellaceae bacterium]|jgi:hypothetical protein
MARVNVNIFVAIFAVNFHDSILRIIIALVVSIGTQNDDVFNITHKLNDKG